MKTRNIWSFTTQFICVMEDLFHLLGGKFLEDCGGTRGGCSYHSSQNTHKKTWDVWEVLGDDHGMDAPKGSTAQIQIEGKPTCPMVKKPHNCIPQTLHFCTNGKGNSSSLSLDGNNLVPREMKKPNLQRLFYSSTGMSCWYIVNMHHLTPIFV